MSTVHKFQGENFYKNRDILTEIKKLAVRKGCSLPQIALAWVQAQGMIPIPGTTKPHRLEENWGCRNVELSEDELSEMRKIIDAAKPVGNRYVKCNLVLLCEIMLRLAVLVDILKPRKRWSAIELCSVSAHADASAAPTMIFRHCLPRCSGCQL
jgi:hypothetical protein